MTKDDRIWSRKVQIINGRRPKRTRTGSSDEPDSSPRLLSKWERSFSNNTTLADMDEQQHARWYAKAVGEMGAEEVGMGMGMVEGPGRGVGVGGGQSPSMSEASRSPLSRESTLWF